MVDHSPNYERDSLRLEIGISSNRMKHFHCPMPSILIASMTMYKMKFKLDSLLTNYSLCFIDHAVCIVNAEPLNAYAIASLAQSLFCLLILIVSNTIFGWNWKHVLNRFNCMWLFAQLCLRSTKSVPKLFSFFALNWSFILQATRNFIVLHTIHS